MEGSDRMNKRKVVKEAKKRTKILKRKNPLKTFVCFGLILFLVSGCINQGSTPAESAPEESVAEQTPPAEQTSLESDVPPISAEDLTITVIYDNNPFNPELTAEWGFSCLIEGYEKTILFDTGGNGSILSENMAILGINPEEIDIIVLSHIHGDHVDGLPAVLRQNSDVTVYVPQSFPYSFKEDVKGYGADVVTVSEPVEICEHVYSTGEMGLGIEEQALIVRTGRGLIVISGCAHPGIVRMVTRAKDFLQDNILFVMGGFHLFDATSLEIREIISDFRELGVLYAGPCHCSGDRTRELFKQEYGQNYIEIGVGTVIRVKDLV